MTQDGAAITGDGSVTFIAVGAIGDLHAFQDYAAQATALLEGAGGTVTARHKVTDSLEGASAPAVVFAMRFESEPVLREALASDAYRALIPLRERAFSRLDLWLSAE